MSNKIEPASKKLPISVQLVALTAVLVFCLAAISVYSYTRVLLISWDEISNLDNLPSLFIQPARSAVLALVSATSFFLLLLRPVTQAGRIATGYIVVLLLWICWEPAFWIFHGQAASLVFSFRRPEMILRYAYFAWICLLFFLINPTILSSLRRR
jgi:hypothetical protein